MFKKSSLFLLMFTVSAGFALRASVVKATINTTFIKQASISQAQNGGLLNLNVNNVLSSVKASSSTTNALAKVPGNSNPLITHKFGADPFAMVYNGRVYVYLSSDAFEYDNRGNVKDNDYSNIKTISVISSNDMVNWTDNGEIPVAGPSGAAKWASNSWAPSATHKVINGKDKFFLYFANNGGGIGVLTSDSPVGPWTDPIGKPLITGSTPGVNGVSWIFDPAVLVDDDGTGYLYFGGGIPGGNNPSQSQIANPKSARVIKLASDMIHTSGSAAAIDSPFMFEDSGIHKYNGKYYYSYCSNFSGTHPYGTPPQGDIAYMTSSSPMGPFTYQGTFLKNPGTYFGVGGNNHHAVFQFNNQWYVVYHAQTLGKAMGITKGYRSPMINKLSYSNGAINNVVEDMQGVPQVSNLNPYERTEAETIAWNGGISTEKCSANGNNTPFNNLDVTSVNNGDWLAVSKADFKNGAASFKASVASTVGGQIEIHLDSVDGALIGTLNVSPTDGEQSFKEMQCNVKSVSGVHNVFFKFVGNSNKNLFNIDYWQFSTNSTNDNPPTPTTTPANNTTLSNGWYYIKNVNAQKYLEVAGNTGKAGQNVDLRTGSGALGQKWYLTNTGDGYVTLTSALGNFMLDIANGANTDGANVQIYNAYSNNAQKYSINPSSTNGAYYIGTVSSNGTKVLDDYNFGTSDGTNVCQWTYGGHTNQLWIFEPTNN
ncbi:carbohydrate-binding protein [Clostridium felsineum]|uniref:carbohydrate-binding protein n=1 Tax=Clostridium felsineum TaxID=36839 RepID=UPI0027DD9836|nr:carbohydrate-binding protein [Clostridium felsineum]MCR3760050.1 carbohydrate-binding protein [Clostridium felsineum]